MSQESVRCQSCAMPMDSGFFGVNTDGSENHEYCRFCWVNGVFAEPELTCAGMIEKSTSHMVRVLQMPEIKAQELAQQMIPTLRRWQ
jgi:Putative zinc ribbon domain